MVDERHGGEDDIPGGGNLNSFSLWMPVKVAAVVAGMVYAVIQVSTDRSGTRRNSARLCVTSGMSRARA